MIHKQYTLYSVDPQKKHSVPQAILKGGMELRLIDCPRYTNDLDYVFVPFESKKDVASLISESLTKFPDIQFSSTIYSACIRYIISRGNVQVQL